MCFVQTSTPPPHMHQKLTKHKRFCKQNNQLPTKSHDELKDNSIIQFLSDMCLHVVCSWILPKLHTTLIQGPIKTTIQIAPAYLNIQWCNIGSNTYFRAFATSLHLYMLSPFVLSKEPLATYQVVGPNDQAAKWTAI